MTLLAHFQSNPGPLHWKALLHVLAYIKGTLNYKIVYNQDMRGSTKPLGYVDVDYSGDLDIRRLMSGYVFLMAGGLVLWSLKWQQMVVLSTTEAKYMSMTRGSQQALWMHNFLLEINFEQPLPATLCVNNNSLIALVKSTKGHAQAKHIDIQYHYV